MSASDLRVPDWLMKQSVEEFLAALDRLASLDRTFKSGPRQGETVNIRWNFGNPR